MTRNLTERNFLYLLKARDFLLKVFETVKYLNVYWFIAFNTESEYNNNNKFIVSVTRSNKSYS